MGRLTNPSSTLASSSFMSYPSLNIAQGIPINVAHTIDSDRLSSATTATARSSARLSATTSADAADTLRSLAYLGVPKGLSNTVAQSVKAHPLRIMIVDNSGSMNTCDGNKMLNNNGSVKMVKCSRWVELSDEVMKVADVSSALNARTDFHLLNPTPNLKQCSIATSAWEGVAPLGPTTDAASLRQSLNKVNPTNTTPLTESVMSVISMISPIAADLRASGQQVAVILATDGHPNNRQSFVQAMQQLQLLPVWVVVRLCTAQGSLACPTSSSTRWTRRRSSRRRSSRSSRRSSPATRFPSRSSTSPSLYRRVRMRRRAFRSSSTRSLKR